MSKRIVLDETMVSVIKALCSATFCSPFFHRLNRKEKARLAARLEKRKSKAIQSSDINTRGVDAFVRMKGDTFASTVSPNDLRAILQAYEHFSNRNDIDAAEGTLNEK